MNPFTLSTHHAGGITDLVSLDPDHPGFSDTNIDNEEIALLKVLSNTKHALPFLSLIIPKKKITFGHWYGNT